MNKVAKEVLMTRYSILPYLYTEFYRVNLEGGTVVRSLAHESVLLSSSYSFLYLNFLSHSYNFSSIINSSIGSLSKISAYFSGSQLILKLGISITSFF